MSYEGGQAIQRGVVNGTRRAPRESRLDGIETCALQAGNQFGVERRHAAIVAAEPASTEVRTAAADPLRPSIGVQTLNWDALICDGLEACDLTHGQACELMVDDDGKPLDQSLWTRMRRDGNLPFKRMRRLPLMFWWHFGIGIGEAAGLDISHASLADVAVGKTQSALYALADLLPVLLRRSA